MSKQPVPVLTIAGSDSGGAAGLQADLKTFTALGVYGMTALTAVTAQNSERVADIHYLPAAFTARQIAVVLDDYQAAAVKTGFIGNVDQIKAIAAQLSSCRERQPFFLLVDPVLVNHRGQAMFDSVVTQAYLEYLFPLADLVTPNRREAALLTGLSVESLDEMEKAAKHLHQAGASAVLLKGGLAGTQIVDLFFDGQQTYPLSHPLIPTTNTHGSGDTLSAAILAFLAHGQPLHTAIERAETFTHRAIAEAATWRLGRGHGPLDHRYVDPDL